MLLKDGPKSVELRRKCGSECISSVEDWKIMLV